MHAVLETSLMQMPILKWYMASLVVKNAHQKTCVTTRLDYVLEIGHHSRFRS